MAITVKHTKVSTIPDGDDSSLIRPSDWNDDHTLIGLGTMAEQDADDVAITGGTISGVALPASDITGTLGVPNGGTGATTLTGYVKGTGTTAMTASATIPNTDITGLGTASTKDAGSPLGVATLDAGGKVPVSELPAAVLGALNYQGTWNASTNTPTLTSSVGTKGYYYVVAVAGSTDLDGITDWVVGDWAVFNGTIWEQVDNTDAVTSVNGQVGTVVLTTTDVGEGTNEYFTQARARASVSAGTGISYDNVTGVITNSSPSLGGDVVGPASATDNALARYDSTTGKIIQNSTVTMDDDGNIANANAISFDTTPATTPTTEGSIYWNTSDGTLDLIMKGGNVVQQIGEEQYYTARNATGSTIPDGTPVMATGVTAGSGRIEVSPAIADGSIDELRFIGLTTESINNGVNGYVTSFGYVRGLDTRGTPYGETWAEGDIIYVSPTTAGYLTNVQPTAPNLKIVVAIVITRHQTTGVLLVRPTAYPHITELNDVNISTPTSGNLLIYDAAQSRWENANLTASTGISITEGAGSVTITNSAPDQVVSLTQGGTTTITGTYPNFTISSDDQFDGTVTSVDLTAGTGISVSGGPITSSGSITVTNTAPDQTVVLNAGTGISTSGTYPNFTVTNTAPDQTVALSAGTGISVSGTYPNFTVTNTAPSSGGTVTSVGGTAPIASSGGNTPTISISQATTSTDGYLSSTDWNTFNSKGNGTVTSVAALTLGTTGTDLSSSVANGTTTPVITLNVPTASATNRGALSAADWTTFNNKAAPFTYTTGYIPYGQGTTTPNQSASLTFASSTLTAPVVSASNGLVVNSNTVSATFSIPSGSSAMSAGPITVNSGVTVTVPSGSRWVIS